MLGLQRGRAGGAELKMLTYSLEMTGWIRNEYIRQAGRQEVQRGDMEVVRGHEASW